jgi:hypothetical protein
MPAKLPEAPVVSGNAALNPGAEADGFFDSLLGMFDSDVVKDLVREADGFKASLDEEARQIDVEATFASLDWGVKFNILKKAAIASMFGGFGGILSFAKTKTSTLDENLERLKTKGIRTIVGAGKNLIYPRNNNPASIMQFFQVLSERMVDDDGNFHIVKGGTYVLPSYGINGLPRIRQELENSGIPVSIADLSIGEAAGNINANGVRFLIAPKQGLEGMGKKKFDQFLEVWDQGNCEWMLPDIAAGVYTAQFALAGKSMEESVNAGLTYVGLAANDPLKTELETLYAEYKPVAADNPTQA